MDGSPSADLGPEPRPAPKVEVVVSVATVVRGLAIFFGLALLFLTLDALLAILLAIVLVLGLDPPVVALERRGIGRGKAAMLVLTALVVTVLVLVVWAVRPVWEEVRSFFADLPGYVDSARTSGVLQDLDKNTEALTKLKEALADAARELPEAAAGVLGTAGSLISGVFQLVTLSFLTLFGLIGKPALTRSALELVRPAPAERVTRTLDEVSRTISYALIGNVVISVIAGTVVGITAVIVDAPTPIVLALIVGFLDLIPQVGSTIAAFIVTLVTLIASGGGPALILLLVILVYQQVENYVIQPAVMREAVELSGFATIAVVIVGSTLLGVVGAILAVPVAASVKVVARELTDDRRRRMATAREALGEPATAGDHHRARQGGTVATQARH
jgi:predicted PurR-regulated permease PerM